MRNISLCTAALLLLALSACTPQPPTGNAAAPPTHWIHGDEILLSVEPLYSGPHGTTLRITAEGDIVYRTLRIDGNSRTFSGEERTDAWLDGTGTAVVTLSPGEHTLRAYSCFETFVGWKCGCRSRTDCGHWMQRTITVE